ncbi:ClpX C4-type zinc finger protein [Planotetraspora mira]|uniref:ClpX C4-type zinc finger protein n=1 Tax=Planotetraspora mira TaxID=58121 RepID=UPI00357167FF
MALDPGSSARRVLNDLGVEPARVKKEVEEWIVPVQRRHRRIGKSKNTDRACSFCGCKDLGPLVAGPGVWICGSCAQTAVEILRAEPRGLRTGWPLRPAADPWLLTSRTCSRRLRPGQQAARMALRKAARATA